MADLARALRGLPVLVGAGGRDDLEPWQGRQFAAHRVRDAVGEVRVVRVANVLERKDGQSCSGLVRTAPAPVGQPPGARAEPEEQAERDERAGGARGPPAPRTRLRALLQRQRELGGSREPVAPVGRHRLEDRGLDRRGHRRPRRPQRRPLGHEVLRQDGVRRGTGEGRLARQHLVEHDGQCVEVDPTVERLAARLLRAHVDGGADDRAGLRDRRVRRPGALRPGVLQRPRYAEVRDQRVTGGEENVLRLDVAVDHAVAVGVVQPVRHLARDAQGFVQRQRALAAKSLAQRLALDVGHGVPQPAVGQRARVEHGEDVRVLQPGRDLDLALEPLGAVRRDQLGVQHLERDGSVVAEVVREVDRGHAAPAELALDGVAALEGLFQRGWHAHGGLLSDYAKNNPSSELGRPADSALPHAPAHCRAGARPISRRIAAPRGSRFSGFNNGSFTKL